MGVLFVVLFGSAIDPNTSNARAAEANPLTKRLVRDDEPSFIHSQALRMLDAVLLALFEEGVQEDGSKKMESQLTLFRDL